MAHRQSEGAHEGLVAFAAQVALDLLAAERVGPIEHPHLDAGGDRRLRRPHRGGGIGVDAVADVLEIDQQQVEAGERAGRRLERLLARAVERHRLDPEEGIALVLRRDHVLLDRPEPVLGREQPQRRAGGGGVSASTIDRGGLEVAAAACARTP